MKIRTALTSSVAILFLAALPAAYASPPSIHPRKKQQARLTTKSLLWQESLTCP
jgi:hypothetical protein